VLSEIEKEIRRSNVPVLTIFFASWCGPCKVMMPIVKNIAETAENKSKIVIIDIEKTPGLADKFKILTLPTFLIWKNGKITKRLVGTQTKTFLLKLLLSNN
jgi:thioredoxin 1